MTEKSVIDRMYTISEISNIGKSTCYVCCLNSEGKAIKPTNLKLVAKHAFLQAPTLKIGWQAPEGILGPGLDITQKYPKHPDTLKH